MKRGKKVLIGILILGIVLVSFGFIVSQEEGELPSEDVGVDLTVSGAGNPPEIVFISDIGGKENIGDVVAAERDLVSEGLSEKDFLFYVWSGGGTSALPSGTLNVDDANLTLYNPGSALVLRSKNCERIADANAPAGSVAYAGQLTAVFNCTVDFPYYSSFGTSLEPNWTVNASVKDIWAQVDSDANSNSEVQPDRFTYFNILRAFALVPSSPSLDYGTVSYGTGLNREPTANYPLVINNTGNADIDVTSLKSYKVNGTTIIDEYIPPEWFSTDPDSACGGGTDLIDETYVNTGLPNILYGADGFDELRICLNQIQTSHAGGSVSQQGYSTSGAERYPWEIDVTYVQ